MEDIVAIISFAVILPTIIALTVTTLRKAKYEANAAAGDGLRASDLQRLIREAVEEAIAPLQERLDRLDGRERPERPAERLDPAVLADALEDPEDDDEPAAVRRRTRS